MKPPVQTTSASDTASLSALGGAGRRDLPSGTLTLLFTDIERSTELLRQVGRARYRELLTAHRELLRRAFEKTGGVEIDHQGDGLLTVFARASDAVVGAVAAQQALAEHPWPDGLDVRVRMGLDTGEITLGEEGYVGYALHRGARICDAGHGGQVLLSNTTRDLVEHDLPSHTRVRPLGQLQLAGLERPEALFQLVIAGLPADFPPLRRGQEDPHGRRQSALLEREAELAALSALIEAARNGTGRLIAIEGRAGMGKTRLVNEARAAASAAGLEVLSARGGELEQDFAYGVVRQLFEPLLASAPAETRAELLADAAGLATPLFDASQLDAALESGTNTSFTVLHGLYWLAANVALRQPAMLAVDDLHWCDAASLRWLVYVARRLEGLPLLVVLGTRPPEQGNETALLTELLSDPAAAVMRPGALGLSSVSKLTREVLRSEPDEAFAIACHKATGGNPLFLRALLDTLAAEGVAPIAEHAERVHDIGPQAVSRAVSLRLSRLPSEANALARAAAVLGNGAQLRHAAALAELDVDVAGHAATTLARADILRLQMPLEFVHPVVRAAVYDAIAAAERIPAHRRAAELLSASRAEPEQAAAHLTLIPPGGDSAVTGTLREAARRALARGAPDTAVVYLRRALEEPPAEAERGELLHELGLVERLVDTAAAIQHLAEAVRHIEDRPHRAKTALEYGRALLRANRHREAIKVFEEAMEHLQAADEDLHNCLQAELIGAASFEPELYPLGLEYLERLREEELGDGIGTDVLLATLAYYEARRGIDRRRSIELAERSLVSGRLRTEGARALYYAGYTLAIAGETEAARRAYDAALAEGRQRGDLVVVAAVLIFRARLAGEGGDLVGAEEALRESMEIGGFQMARPYHAGFLTDVLIARGELEEAAKAVALAGLGDQVPANAHLFFFLAARARLRLETRKPEQALEDFLMLGRHMEALEVSNPAFVAWRSGASAALLALGRVGEARELAREELDLARRWGAPAALGVALRALGLAEGGQTGEQLLREAVGGLADSPAKLEYARALVELGAALRRANQRAEARDLLRQGLEIAHRAGAKPLAERASAELAATGARARTLVLTGLDALTPSERRIAEMAADNMSNKDIAQALFVTPKTVEVHLSNVYRKLGIASRSQLADALAPAAAESAAASA